jgi:glycosyltransferase involved in cell wall biosynthesis
VAPGVAKFLYNIALKIAKKRNIPIITYICDEYYFVKEPGLGLDRLRLRLLQKKMDTLMTNSRHLVVICDELKEAYGKKFGVPATTLMTGTNYTPAEQISAVSEPRHIAYFGNIRCNRYLSLAQIGEELDAINKERGTQYRLKIYTSEKDPVFLEPLQAVESIELCGFIMGEEFDRVFHSAQLLLHAEAFDEASIDFTQHSVSTKIADSLASGIPLLAYGPECISSMKHLIRNRCALIATSPKELRQVLLAAFEDEAARATAARNGLATTEKYHRTDRAGEKLREIISEISC